MLSKKVQQFQFFTIPYGFRNKIREIDEISPLKYVLLFHNNYATTTFWMALIGWFKIWLTARKEAWSHGSNYRFLVSFFVFCCFITIMQDPHFGWHWLVDLTFDWQLEKKLGLMGAISRDGLFFFYCIRYCLTNFKLSIAFYLWKGLLGIGIAIILRKIGVHKGGP